MTSALHTLVWDLVRFGFSAMMLGVVVAVAVPGSSASSLLLVGGLTLMLSGVVGAVVLKWWDYREGNEGIP